MTRYVGRFSVFVILVFTFLLITVSLMLFAPRNGSQSDNDIRFRNAQLVAAELEKWLQISQGFSNTLAYTRLMPVSPFHKELMIYVSGISTNLGDYGLITNMISQFCKSNPNVVFKGDVSRWKNERNQEDSIPVWVEEPTR